MAPESMIAAVSTDEAVRVLRSNLLVSLSGIEHPTIVVTSPLSGEGKTTTTARLAVSLAEAGRRVIVLDFDLRHPDIHRLLGGRNDVGLTDVLVRGKRLDECFQYINVGARQGRHGLYLLATGAPVHNPAELLGSKRTQTLLDAVSRQADIVLVDTPPVLPVADTLEIGRVATGALLVIQAKSTPLAMAMRAKDALIRNQTRLLGLVVNKVRERDQPYGYGYGYGYGTDYTEDVDEDIDYSVGDWGVNTSESSESLSDGGSTEFEAASE